MEESRLEVVTEAHEIFDRFIRKAVGAAYRQGMTVPCGKGCFACCYEPAHVARQEVERILHELARLPAAEQERVKAATKDWYERFQKSGLQAVKEPSVFVYRAAKLACPLLKDGRCLVYEARPLACRGHIAVGERRQCEDDQLRKHQRYMNTSGFCGESLAMIGEHEDLEMDHLGVMLYEELFGVPAPSAGRCGLKVEREGK